MCSSLNSAELSNEPLTVDSINLRTILKTGEDEKNGILTSSHYDARRGDWSSNAVTLIAFILKLHFSYITIFVLRVPDQIFHPKSMIFD